MLYFRCHKKEEKKTGGEGLEKRNESQKFSQCWSSKAAPSEWSEWKITNPRATKRFSPYSIQYSDYYEHLLLLLFCWWCFRVAVLSSFNAFFLYIFLYIFLSFFHSLTYTHTNVQVFFTSNFILWSGSVSDCVAYSFDRVCALLVPIIIACLLVCLLFKAHCPFCIHTIFMFHVRIFQSIFSRYCLVPYNDGVLLILCCYILCVWVCVFFFFIISHSDTMHTNITLSYTNTHSYTLAYARTLFIRFPFRFLSLIQFIWNRARVHTYTKGMGEIANECDREREEIRSIHARVCWYVRAIKSCKSPCIHTIRKKIHT